MLAPSANENGIVIIVFNTTLIIVEEYWFFSQGQSGLTLKQTHVLFMLNIIISLYYNHLILLQSALDA
jgi:hypothetical protein